ncbi:MAG TPA: SDR family oxidoreductase [Ktedonobacteraceae bacterium]|nr:SDR family oxidoreductase [Ktedonobacteraceae bacterium]
MYADKNIVITGAGRGIGRALALAFAERGARVLVHYGHARLEAESVVNQIKSSGGEALLVQADLAQKEEAQRLVERARELLGVIDVWINNAGASANSSEARDLDESERFERMLAVDVLASWICCRGVAEYMRAGGSILNLSWNHALDGAPGFASQLYATSKGAVISMTRSLARTYAPHIRVNCIAPGWIENEWVQSQSANFRQRVTQQIPLGRWGTASDIVTAALFLASPAASFITGQVLLVDGGEVMQ